MSNYWVFMGLLKNRNPAEGGLTGVFNSGLYVSHPFSGTVAGPGIIFMVIIEGPKRNPFTESQVLLISHWPSVP